MANEKNIKPGEEVVVVDVNAPVEAVVLEEKMVKAIPNATLGQLFVGAGWLVLEKDKEIEVTQDQKRCLKEAGVIYI